MKADLERRVHELLDAGRDPGEDPQVRSAIADDGEAREEVAALSKLEGWLRDWEVSVPEEDLEPIAQRIEQRLDEPLGSFDAIAPPTFDDPDARVSPLGGDRAAGRSGEYSLDALAGAVEAPSPAQMTGPSPAVSLSAPPRPERKQRAPVAPWVAAAAVVALGVMVSLTTLQQGDEPAAVASEAPAQEELPASPAEPGTALEEADQAWPAEAEEAEEAEPMEEETAEAAAEAPLPSSAATATATEGATTATRRRRSRATGMAASGAQRSAAALDDLAGGGGSAPAAQARGRDAVERSRAGVRACLGSGTDSAVVMVRFRDGTVRDARVVRPAGNDATNQCVASALRRARVRPEGEQARRTLYYRWGGLPENAYGN